MPAAASNDRGRAYWERHAKRYDRSTRFLFEAAGLRVERAETIPGPFPIGYIAALTA